MNRIRGLLILWVVFCILGQSRAELKPLLLLPYEDYYIKGSYRFQSKKEGLETGEFEVLRKHGRDVYCKVLSNGDAVVVPNKKHDRNTIQWPAKLCYEKLNTGDRSVFLSNSNGGIVAIELPPDKNKPVVFCEPLSAFLRDGKILSDFSHASIQVEGNNKYVLRETKNKSEQKMLLTLGTQGLISHADVEYAGKWASSIDIEYSADSDFPRRYSKKRDNGSVRSYEFDEVLTGTAAAERLTTLTLLQNGLMVSDNRFKYVNYPITNGAFLSDEEAAAMDRKIRQEVDARNAARQAAILAARTNAATVSAVANDPHNVKDVPVTGKSWGNRLRRVPNWAYGGAVVLFLGGWIVAASRRRRR